MATLTTTKLETVNPDNRLNGKYTGKLTGFKFTGDDGLVVELDLSIRGSARAVIVITGQHVEVELGEATGF